MMIKTKSEKKQVAINLIANIVAYAASICISFLLTPFLVDKLGKEIYGFYPMANTFLNYMIIVTNALNSISSRFITVSIARKNEVDAQKYFKATLLVDAVISFILLLIMGFITIFLDSLLNIPDGAVDSIRILFACIFASGIINIGSSVFGVSTFSKNRIDLRSLRELVTSIVRVILILLAYLFLPTSIIYIGIVAVIIAILNLIFQIFYTKKLLPGFISSKPKLDWHIFKEILSSSLWSIISSLGNNMIAGTVLIASNIFFGETASGTISIAQTIPGFLSGIVTVLVGVFYPIIMYKVARDDKEGLTKVIQKVMFIVGGFGIAVICVFSAVSSSFFSLWMPNEDNLELMFVSFLAMIPYATISAFWVCQSVYNAFNKIKIPALVTLITGISNILFMCILGLTKAPYWSLVLCSSVHVMIWSGIFMPFYLKRIAGLKMFDIYFPFLKAIVYGILCFGICYVITIIIPINSWIKFILYAIIVGGFSLLAFYYLMDKKMFMEYFNMFLSKLRRKKN